MPDRLTQHRRVCFTGSAHDRWRESSAERRRGEFVTPAGQRHRGVLNHPCFTLQEQWVCGRGSASRPKSATSPAKSPSAAALHLRRRLAGPAGPPSESPSVAFFSTAVEAVGEGLAWALLSAKMADHLLSAADTTSSVRRAGRGTTKVGLGVKAG